MSRRDLLRPLGLAGAFLLERHHFADHRGTFDRAWDRELLAAHGLVTELAQVALATNAKAGTLRGMHFQLPPAAETKVVRVLRGAIVDALVDLREGSPTAGKMITVRLDADSPHALYVPAGLAHGYQALADDTHVLYTMSAPYSPEAARGLRWDDPDLAIPWPIRPPVLSERDATLPLMAQVALLPGMLLP